MRLAAALADFPADGNTPQAAAARLQQYAMHLEKKTKLVPSLRGWQALQSL